MTKHISSSVTNEVLYRVFTDGRITQGRIFSVYAFITYCAIEHINDDEAILRVFDNFYLNDLKPWIEKYDASDQLHTAHQKIRGPVELLNCRIL